MHKLKRVLLIIIGSLFVIIGIIGAILPVMPSTIFFMIAGLCYINSSKTLYRKLISVKYIGPTIESYVERREVTRNFKIGSLLFMIIPTIITQVFIVNNWTIRIFSIILVVLLSWHFLSLKTVSKEEIIKNSNQIDDKFQ
ncbi:MAG TPA: YbaN family protein [Haloplasmataceae bacterium]